MKKYTAEPAKVHLNSVMETIRNRSIMKNIGEIKSFTKTPGTILHFKKMPTKKKNRYLLFMLEQETL